MDRHKQPRKVRNRAKRPLDAAQLQELALAYVARYATSTAKLARYLKRKIRERGWDQEADSPPDIEEIVNRYAELGYIDDEAFARSKSGSLLRRGYGPRRVSQALGMDGISAEIREEVEASEAELRHAALAMARKRRFGPFGPSGSFGKERPDRDRREKQLAAMIRAGHDLDSAREMVDAESEDAAEEWAHELDEEPYGGTI